MVTGLQVWAEGVEGAVHLEIHSIKAINCAGGGTWSHAAAMSSDESEDGGEPDDD